ncbi:MAG TPA: hypothetical protein VL242_49140 [Sorangium sp.]|nr:hypothetical protein [Sorangium sp.]
MASIFPAREARIKRRVRAGIGGVARPPPFFIVVDVRRRKGAAK